MNTFQKKHIYAMWIILAAVILTSGCEEPTKNQPTQKFAPELELDVTIGDLVEIFSVNSARVEGYAIVGGLNGTGSSECPADIRDYLVKYIHKQLPTINAEDFINSHDTAVVAVSGIIPAETSKNEHFDLKVSALPKTQTTSLKNGWLYSTDLKEAGRLGTSIKSLAEAKGPVYIDTLAETASNEKEGYILDGGIILEDHHISLVLKQPNYKTASVIRNRLNERFGSETTKAVSPSQIEMTVPAKYRGQKQRFISILNATYLSETEELTQKRISHYIKELAVSPNKYASEITLEAIGNESLSKLAALLNSTDEEVQLCTTRCMLNLGSDIGLEGLRKIVMNKNSVYRIEALEAITTGARRNDAAAVSRRLVQDEDFNIKLAAYESLRKLDDVTITSEFVAHNFYLEQISQSTKKDIFVSRSGQPRIVLFGAPMYCRENIFVQSPDGIITINAPTGQKTVTIIRKHPKRPNVVAKLECSFELGDIIRRLCEPTVVEDKSKNRQGLGVSYADTIALLKQMCDKGAVEAEFHAGALPKIDVNIKK
jgi:flagellar basal body P-ring protein FlgI